MRRAHVIVITGLAMLIAVIPSFGSSIAPPRDLGTLARISRLVVFAESLGSTSGEQGSMAGSTVTAFRVLQTLKGKPVTGTLEVREMEVVGAPQYEKGGRYVLFLDPAPGGRWQSKMLAYGILREDGATGTFRPLPEASQLYLVPGPGVEPVGTYEKDRLLQHLGAVASGSTPWYRQAAEIEQAELTAATEKSGTGTAGAALHSAPAACRFEHALGFPARWFGFETGGSVGVWHTTPGQTGIGDGGVSAVQEGVTAWRNHLNSVANLLYSGSRPATFNCASPNGAFEADNEVIFNDPCGQIADLTSDCGGSTPPGHWGPNCCGMVSLTKVEANNNPILQHDGESWKQITGLSILINNGAQCVGELDFKEVITHSLGHGLGFAHHTDPNATMFANLGAHPQRGAALAQTDLTCASYAYHTFVDVPFTRWSWPFVEAVENAGLTAGCGGGNFCPTSSLTRAEMAIFILRGSRGAAFVPPPATGTMFQDVPASHFAAAWIEQLANDGLTAGCGTNPPRYCPNDIVTRDQMATFLINIGHGPGYTPPPATGTVFADVPASYWAAAHIEQLFAEGGTGGCQTNPLRYCPTQAVLREEMAVFLVNAFDLVMP
jgi:S-layer homology domain